jgi:DNA-directed RNA polymerase specialized sigma24 family protein
MSNTDVDLLPTGSLFPSTHWSVIALATGASAPAAHAALGNLLTRYMPALKAHLVITRRLNPHTADDLLQGFIAERVLDRKLLAKADHARGRFRAFLVTCLNRYVYDMLRREGSAKRHPGLGNLVPLEFLDEKDVTSRQPTECDAFDLAWARQVLADALERMRMACEQSLRPDLWSLFQARIVAPATEGIEPISYQQLTRTFHYVSVAQATNALVTAKRMYARMLRAVVAEYVPEPEVDDELCRLKRILAQSGRRSGSGAE